MDDVIIRPATAEDAPDVREVARESWHAAYDDIVGAERVESVVDSWYDRDGLERSVAREDGRFLVAEAETEAEQDSEEPNSEKRDSEKPDGEIVGFAQAVLGDEDDEQSPSNDQNASSSDDAAELPRIYVHPDHWGDGIGSELIDCIESWLRARGAERLRLIVLADNEVGNAFYEKRGYRIVGSRESEVEGETYTDYVREKEL